MLSLSFQKRKRQAFKPFLLPEQQKYASETLVAQLKLMDLLDMNALAQLCIGCLLVLRILVHLKIWKKLMKNSYKKQK